MLVSALLPGAAMALDWQIDPSIGATTTLTDNATQTKNGDGAFIVTVTPGVAVKSKGSRRVQASLNYGLSATERIGGGGTNDSNDLNHSLNATGKAEVAEDLFFIEGDARISQALTSLLGAPGDSTLDTGNRSTVGTYNLSPYLTKRFGTFGNGVIRFTQSGAIFEQNTGGDITSSAVRANFTSGSRFNDLLWGLNYSLRDASTEGRQDTQFESYGATLGYALTRKFRLRGSFGYDNNDYPATAGTKTKGDYWTAGFDWAPSRRTSLGASLGKRYYGDNYALNFRHRMNRSIWHLQYDEGASDIEQQIFNTTVLYAWQCDDGTWGHSSNVFPPEGKKNCVLLASIPPGTLYLGTDRGISINKTLRGGMTWAERRMTYSVDLFDTTRAYQELSGLPEDRTRGLQAGVNYKAAPHTSVNALLGFTNNKVAGSLIGVGAVNRDDDIYTLTVGINHQFLHDLNGSLYFRHQQRESNDSAQEFSENSLSATVTMRF